MSGIMNAHDLVPTKSEAQLVFELSVEGNSRRAIAKLLNKTELHIKYVRSTDEYKALKDEYYSDNNFFFDTERQANLIRFKQSNAKSFDRLLQLCDSENEKIALEAAKFLQLHAAKLESDFKDVAMEQLNQMFDKLKQYQDAIEVNSHE